jgi:hypothetical protein
MPFVAVWIVAVLKAVVGREIGGRLRFGMFLEIGRGAYEDVPP